MVFDRFKQKFRFRSGPPVNTSKRFPTRDLTPVASERFRQPQQASKSDRPTRIAKRRPRRRRSQGSNTYVDRNMPPTPEPSPSRSRKPTQERELNHGTGPQIDHVPDKTNHDQRPRMKHSSSMEAIDSLSELLYSPEYLQSLLHSVEHLSLFVSFLEKYKPTISHLVLHYLQTEKVIKAVDYANAVAATLTHADFITKDNPAKLAISFRKSSDEAFQMLLDIALPAWVTWCLVRASNTCLAADMTGTSTSLTRNLIGGLSEVFCLTDPNQNDNPIVYASREFYRMTGFGRDSVVGRNCRFLQGSKTNKGNVRRLNDAVQNGEEICETILNYRRNGQPFINILMLTPLVDDEGKVKYYMAAQLDATKLVEGGRGVDGFGQFLAKRTAMENINDGSTKQLALSKLRDLGTSLESHERAILQMHFQTIVRSVDSEDTSASYGRRRVADDEEDSDSEKNSSEHSGVIQDSALNVSHERTLGRLPVIYKKYVVIRPYPSLEVVFSSPSAKKHWSFGHDSFLTHLAAPASTVSILEESFQLGIPITAKVAIMPEAGSTTTGTVTGKWGKKDGPAYMGEVCWVSATPLLDGNDNTGFWMVVIMNNIASASHAHCDASKLVHAEKEITKALETSPPIGPTPVGQLDQDEAFQVAGKKARPESASEAEPSKQDTNDSPGMNPQSPSILSQNTSPKQSRAKGVKSLVEVFEGAQGSQGSQDNTKAAVNGLAALFSTLDLHDGSTKASNVQRGSLQNLPALPNLEIPAGDLGSTADIEDLEFPPAKNVQRGSLQNLPALPNLEIPSGELSNTADIESLNTQRGSLQSLPTLPNLKIPEGDDLRSTADIESLDVQRGSLQNLPILPNLEIPEGELRSTADMESLKSPPATLPELPPSLESHDEIPEDAGGEKDISAAPLANPPAPPLAVDVQDEDIYQEKATLLPSPEFYEKTADNVEFHDQDKPTESPKPSHQIPVSEKESDNAFESVTNSEDVPRSPSPSPPALLLTIDHLNGIPEGKENSDQEGAKLPVSTSQEQSPVLETKLDNDVGRTEPVQDASSTRSTTPPALLLTIDHLNGVPEGVENVDQDKPMSSIENSQISTFETLDSDIPQDDVQEQRTLRVDEYQLPVSKNVLGSKDLKISESTQDTSSMASSSPPALLLTIDYLKEHPETAQVTQDRPETSVDGSPVESSTPKVQSKIETAEETHSALNSSRTVQNVSTSPVLLPVLDLHSYNVVVENLKHIDRAPTESTSDALPTLLPCAEIYSKEEIAEEVEDNTDKGNTQVSTEFLAARLPLMGIAFEELDDIKQSVERPESSQISNTTSDKDIVENRQEMAYSPEISPRSSLAPLPALDIPASDEVFKGESDQESISSSKTASPILPPIQDIHLSTNSSNATAETQDTSVSAPRNLPDLLPSLSSQVSDLTYSYQETVNIVTALPANEELAAEQDNAPNTPPHNSNYGLSSRKSPDTTPRQRQGSILTLEAVGLHDLHDLGIRPLDYITSRNIPTRQHEEESEDGQVDWEIMTPGSVD